MEAILRAIENLHERLEQLVEYTRPLVLEEERVVVSEWIEEARAAIAKRCEDLGVGVSIEVDENLPELTGDPAKLREALLHLMINGIEATPEGGTLRVRASAPGKKKVRVEVLDEGGGLPPEHAKEVGVPFFTTKAGGVGLGVAIAKRIATAHGGSFEFRSEVGEGSAAAITLPAGKRG